MVEYVFGCWDKLGFVVCENVGVLGVEFVFFVIVFGWWCSCWYVVCSVEIVFGVKCFKCLFRVYV